MNSRASLFTFTDLLLLSMVSIWAVNFTVVKNVIGGALSPVAFTTLRFALASLILLPLARRGGPPLRRADLWRIGAAGFIGNALYQVLFINGLALTSPTNGALLNATAPIFIALLGVLLKIETLSARAWAGVWLSFVGIGVVVLGNAPIEAAAGSANSWLGDLMILGAALMWSCYTVLSAPLLHRHSPLRLTALTVATGTLPLLLIAAPDFAATDWPQVGLSTWLAVLFSGGLAIALCYMLWNRGVQQVGGARTAVYSNLTPVLTALFAFVARGDVLTIYHAGGAVIILTGITLTRSGRRRPAGDLVGRRQNELLMATAGTPIETPSSPGGSHV